MQLACIVLQIKGRYFHSNILSEVRSAAETETDCSTHDEAAKQRSCYMLFHSSSVASRGKRLYVSSDGSIFLSRLKSLRLYL